MVCYELVWQSVGISSLGYRKLNYAVMDSNIQNAAVNSFMVRLVLQVLLFVQPGFVFMCRIQTSD